MKVQFNKKNHSDHSMSKIELQASWGLGCVFFLRMLGIFMVLPVLTTYGINLKHSSETLIGLAIGIYGLMQAIFQIPYGLMSDKIGRKPLIIFGLVLFIIGSIIAASTESIWGIIIGRALQGCGSIASPIMALLSDLTKEQNRTKAMVFIGINFGVSFTIAMLIGPIITDIFGIKGLFWIMSLLAVFCILIIIFIVPSTKYHVFNRESGVLKSKISQIFLNKKLTKINIGILFLHTFLMFTFITLPEKLKLLNFPINQNWKIYFFTMIISFLFAVPVIFYAEVKRRIKSVLISSIALIIISEFILFTINNHIWMLILAVQLFFFCFNLLEAILPSLISKETPAGYKGTAMGIYSTSQFIGIAVGGGVGGWLNEHFQSSVPFLVSAFLAIIWFFISLSMKEPSYLSSIRIVLDKNELCFINNQLLIQKLKNNPGVYDVLVVPEEKSLYIKIDTKITNRFRIESFINSHGIYC